MTARRIVEGILYAYAQGGHVFAFLATNRPYDIKGCNALFQRARECSGNKAGTITVRLVESGNFPDRQGFAVLSSRRGVRHSSFEAVIGQLFPSCTLQMRWVTTFEPDSGHLLLALITRQILQNP